MKAWILGRRERRALSRICVPIRRAWPPEAKTGAREWIAKQLGAQYLPDTPNAYKGKKDAQDAHEAIRPTDAARTPESIARFLTDEQMKLYTLIWRRFVASQMVPAVYDVTTANIAAVSAGTGKTYDFRVSGSVLRFDGFLKVYEVSEDKKDEDNETANRLPSLDGVKTLELDEFVPEDHFTQPPPRYNEASLVKELEERGIGRPSTYASIISTIQDREYVVKHGGSRGRFYPTEIGVVVCDLLVENFPYIFDTAYTAKLETELDNIEEGTEKWTDLLNGFYGYFEQELKDAGKHMRNIKRMEQVTDEKCDVCGSPLVLKWGKFGTFYACSAYDKKDPASCTFTKENIAAKPDLNTPEAQEAGDTEEYCENCGKVMVMRRGLFGPFMACPDYNADPPCKTFRKLSQKQQREAARADRRALPCMRKAAGAAPGSVRRVRLVLRLSQVQIREAEFDRGDEVPQVRRGRPGRASRAQGQHLLGLHELSQVRLYLQPETGGEEVPQVRQPVSDREDAQVGRLPRMPE